MDDPKLKKLADEADAVGKMPGGKPAASPSADADEEDEDDELELDDDEDDEDLVVFTAREAAGALATIYGFVKPYLGNYKKLLAFVGFGVLVETLFNVIMPLSLKFLIDDALGEEDFQALYKILGVLAAAGIVTSIIAVWYERWDARLAAGLDLRRADPAVRARPEPAVRLFCPHQAWRNPVAFLDRPGGLRKLDQELCQQRRAAVPGIDRRHHPDAVFELAARGDLAAGVSDHADRPADPDAEGGAGQLRAEAA